MGDSVVVEVVKNPSAWGIALVLAGLAYLFWRDIKNPEKAASASVLAGMADTSVDVFELAQKAMDQASKALDEALAAKRSNLRCEARFSAALAHNRALMQQVVDAGLVPVPPPITLDDE